MKHPQEVVNEILKLSSQGLSSRKIAKKVFGKDTSKSTVNDILKREREAEADTSFPKILFIDVENQGSLNISFPRFKAFISPQAVLKEPYLLTYACNWAHEGEQDIECVGLDDLPAFEEDSSNDIMLVERLWELLDEADIIVAHNAGFDEGVINARFAYYGFPPPSPYKVVCTLKALKKHFKLPANSLDASTKYFELERKLSNEGIGLWVDCYLGKEEAFEEMKEYNRGDIPTLRQLYFKILPFIKNHPNLGLYYNDDKLRCNNCGSESMVEEVDKKAYTNLSSFSVYRCSNCGSVKRDRKNTRSKDQMSNTLMNIV